MRMSGWMLTWLAAGAVIRAESAELTPAAMMSWTVVSHPSSTESERYAASEFQRLFEGLTGARIPVTETAPTGGGAVFIGPEAARRPDQPADPEAWGEEGFRIQVGARALWIEGGRPRGTLYGVYEFFEALCGVRFLTHDHTHYPAEAAQRAIPLGTHEVKPTFAFRWSYYGENSRHPEYAARLRVNTVSDDPKLGGRTGYRLVSHNVAYLVPPAQYGQAHPEYYALVGGERRLDQGGGGPQLCMTHPDVLERVVQAVLDEIRRHPEVRNFNVAQMDNEGYCTCPGCAAIDAREESHAGATLALVNAVAERIEPLHPEVLISTYAYQYTRKPPKTLKPRRNVLIQLCSIECCDFHAIDDPACPLNRSFCQDLDRWQQLASHLFIWHYNTNFKGYLLPFPNLRSIGPSVACFAKNKGRGVFMQAAGNGFATELSDLRNYVMARCLWRPGRDSWQEAQEFCRLHYAEAAGPILAYLEYYHDLVSAAGVHPTCFPTEAALAIGPESARRIVAYFQDALALARSEAVRDRVAKASLCAYRAALSAASMRLVYRDGVCRPDLTGFGPDLVERYAALCTRFGVTMEDEHLPVAPFLEATRRLHAGLEAVRLENDFWRVILLPESNGKVVEMTYRPTGRNVVHARRSFTRFRHEEWVRQGEGPTSPNIVAFGAQADPNQAVLSLTTSDGARLERRILLTNDVVRFETTLTAGRPRAFEVLVHPEYDTATSTDDPAVLAIYVKSPEWVQANRGWAEALPTEPQLAAIQSAAAGGAFAYYNHQAKFGVAQRFDPLDFSALALFWNPSRQQINLELISKAVQLEPGQRARYAYEVRYLDIAPSPGPASARQVQAPVYAPSPPDNPLKGFVPYLRKDDTFPHSLEWDYTKLSEVMTGPADFDWAPFDAKLAAAASRGHQFFARFYLEWPGKTTGVPRYLIDGGLELRTWTNTNTQPFPPAVDHTPDYEDPRLRAALTNFIHALGRRYDGDPRLGFVGLGLLGTWGEWHNHPNDQWFASKTVQREVMDAYEAAFKQTKLVARYPAGPNDPRYADNARRAIGYHDDSFAWATVHTGKNHEQWFFETRLRSAGALDKWRIQPIGGEVRPEVWQCLFDEPSCAPAGQEFDRCVAVTHASWLCNEGVFRGRIQGAARERAIRAAQRMGYELHVARVEWALADRQLTVALTVTNTGVAPFYYDWPVELAALGSDGKLAATWPTDWKLTGVLPAEPATRWRMQTEVRALPPGAYRLLLRVPNPLPNGPPLRFANRSQDQHRPGWLTLGEWDQP
ncbi:MAG: DUF4838 domain-containing protein [Verrucomicrobia bacterium]|nr:DUF4838 domain-containing protein [Verrucomicrobiota bacterium]